MWRPPLIFNLPTRLASITSVFVLYVLGPLTLFFFSYEALKVPQTPSLRYGVVGFFTSLIKGPRHSLSPVSCVIPLSMIAVTLVAFLFGRRVIEPHTRDWKRIASLYRYVFSFVALVAFVVLAIALVCPWYLWKFPLNLNNADLRQYNLSYLDLSGAMAWNANLQGVDISHTKLDDADLVSANLRGAIVKSASVQRVHLQGADLSGADFTNSYLTGANLCATSFVGARFDPDKLGGVNYDYADLTGTGLKEAARASCFTSSNVKMQLRGTDCLVWCSRY